MSQIIEKEDIQPGDLIYIGDDGKIYRMDLSDLAIHPSTDAGRVFWVNIRASLIKEAKDLQEQRAAKLGQAAEIEKILKVDGTQKKES